MPNTPVSTFSTLPAHLHPNINALLRVIASPIRRAMLTELSGGEPRMIIELARKAGCTPAMAGKHLSQMRQAGVVELTRRNYQLPRHFILDAARGHLDFGHCLLRLTQPTEQPPELK